MLVCENAIVSTPKAEEKSLFVLDRPTLQCKRLKEPNYSIIVQIVSKILRFIEPSSKNY